MKSQDRAENYREPSLVYPVCFAFNCGFSSH